MGGVLLAVVWGLGTGSRQVNVGGVRQLLCILGDLAKIPRWLGWFLADTDSKQAERAECSDEGRGAGSWELGGGRRRRWWWWALIDAAHECAWTTSESLHVRSCRCGSSSLDPLSGLQVWCGMAERSSEQTWWTVGRPRCLAWRTRSPAKLRVAGCDGLAMLFDCTNGWQRSGDPNKPALRVTIGDWSSIGKLSVGGAWRRTLGSPLPTQVDAPHVSAVLP